MKIANRSRTLSWFLICMFPMILVACGQRNDAPTMETTTRNEPTLESETAQLTDTQVEDIVRRSYRFVALYNVNNKMAMDPANPLATGGWNVYRANPVLTDHTVQIIARPNNDTLYGTATIDLSEEPVILEAPAFDSKYVSLMVTGYDHYVNIPMSTRQGHFSSRARILFYTERTPGYSGEAVDGVDMIAEMSGDFISAVFRVMPHANEPARMQGIIDAMNSAKVVTLSEYRSGTASESSDSVDFPPFGRSDFDLFSNNLLEVMQFVFNHTTFDPKDELDQELIAAFAPLGVIPGRQFDATVAARIDGARFRAAAEKIFKQEMAKATDPQFLAENGTGLFLPKGKIKQELLLFQSILGPIGLPATEAVYPSIGSADGSPMNAMHDYVISMAPDAMPPATAFWSLTLYDSANGFFMPNDRKKYSVGENAGMKLDEDGGITVYVAAEQPEGVPDENWLPLVRGDYAIDIILRLYAPDLQAFATWTLPKAEVVE